MCLSQIISIVVTVFVCIIVFAIWGDTIKDACCKVLNKLLELVGSHKRFGVKPDEDEQSVIKV